MNQKLKHIGLYAILAVFTISLTTSFVGDAEALSKAEQRAQLLENLKVEASPSLLQVMVVDSATKAGKDFVVTGEVTTFTAIYAVLNPTNIDLRDVEILVTSDTESVKGVQEKSSNPKFSTITVEIDAVDPASIKAKIIG